MSTQAVQAMAPRTARPAKAVAKTADFKGALVRAQAPFAPAPAATAVARAGDSTFRSRIAAQESAGAGWAARNAASGALGRYQMLPVALRDIGWQGADGGWTERAAAMGVRSEADFLANPAAQEAAMGQYLQRTERQLAANGALDAAGRTVTATDGQPLAITQAGLVAAAHRRGAGTVARWLDHRTRTPDAPLPEATRAAFASVERRLRDFAGTSVAAGARVSPSA
ncbi:hypothetical protein [Roseomonas populi]|uniref:Lytic transglycosylase domain-containing protein n=1 Tax=Roseomonas populi TaxID=3121582 RepID=A0ABT1X6L3_9PROT|nr:hypothetical protein [Roseomonas pecuniae]MCR0983364.1 hypothetical protein [Roseomonas pecuniae]